MGELMKVLLVSESDIVGGAARAAYRLHSGLRSIGVDSRMLVQHKKTDDRFVTAPRGRLSRTGNFWREKSRSLLKLQQTTNPVFHSLNMFPSGFADIINNSDADVVNLHWVGKETIGIAELARIRKPLVWTMHDMWAFSGCEHYDHPDHPGRFRQGYFSNNRPLGEGGLDWNRFVWNLKRRFWKPFQLVTPSHWLARMSRESNLMHNWPVATIHNGIDQSVFRPISRPVAHELLGLDTNKRYILFGADYGTKDKRKGFHLLLPALHALKRMGHCEGVELLVFGGSELSNPPDFPLPVHYLGRLEDEISLALLYNAADVFVSPSMQENLANTLVESLSCGTPCVAFRVGGMEDLVGHGINGYLASPFNADEMASCIQMVLGQPDERMRNAAREYSRRFEAKKISEEYLEMYRAVCSGTKR